MAQAGGEEGGAESLTLSTCGEDLVQNPDESAKDIKIGDRARRARDAPGGAVFAAMDGHDSTRRGHRRVLTRTTPATDSGKRAAARKRLQRRPPHVKDPPELQSENSSISAIRRASCAAEALAASRPDGTCLAANVVHHGFGSYRRCWRSQQSLRSRRERCSFAGDRVAEAVIFGGNGRTLDVLEFGGDLDRT